MPDDDRPSFEEQSDEQLAAAGQQAALRQAAEQQQRTLKNEHFLNELRRADIDSDVFDWLEDEYPAWFSGAHAVSNRDSEWDLSADLIMQSKRERAYAQNNPGRLLEGRPFLLSTAQGADAPGADAFMKLDFGLSRGEWERRLGGKTTMRDPMTSEERQAMYDSAEVAADLMALSKNGAGLEATTTATTETRVRRESEEETTARRLGSVFE
jgi:hypothetical protein